MNRPIRRSCSYWTRFASGIVAVLWMGAGTGVAADPGITRQPEGGLAGVGESFQFEVEVEGTPPFAYQWRFNRSAMSGQTNQTLVLTNVTFSRAGEYSVVVTNSLGSVTSSNALLHVTDQSPRFLATGAVKPGAEAKVQILFIGNGTENSVSFSLGFDTNVLITHPIFEAAATNATISLDRTQDEEGSVGVTVALDGEGRFEPGQQVLGQFLFVMGGGDDVFEGGLIFTNAPVDIRASNTFGQALVLEAGVVPSLTPAGPPVLNRQSGLFEHRMTAGNPGAMTVSNLLLIASGLASDSLTNLITLYNAQGTVGGAGFTPGVAVDLRGAFAGEPFVRLRDIAPAESRPLTLEYYVSDHQTVPEPEYVMLMDEGFVFRLPRRTERVRI
ncbi:MAG TPA: immunoglobulin domain-containing protein, partial [Methylomirabilota bacterium]|nr:immunoglobulin domain-containing protein [Methylomirabilota bacterium]